jgi:hypothetical protein
VSIAGQALVLEPTTDGRTTLLYFSRKGTLLSVLQSPMQMPPPTSMPEPDLP